MSKNSKPIIYILITILFSYILNFITTNPTTWKEFPPKLPTTVFISLYLIPNLLFVAFSFEPITTRKRCYTLIISLLLSLLVPFSYRLKYHPMIINSILTNAALWSFKMSLFIKHNRKYLPYTKINQQKEFTPFLLSLLNWRDDSYIISPSKIEPPTLSQINERLKSRALILIFKWFIYELVIYLFVSFPQKIPDKPYQIRVIEYFTKGIPFVTTASMLHYLCFFGFIFFFLSLDFDITVVLSLMALRHLTITQSTNQENHYLVRLGLLSPLQFSPIKNYLIEYTFNTKHCFNYPFISTNPREFWSMRWQNMFGETFKELGYLPLKNLCFSLGITSKKFCNAMGVFGAFFISALLHEYLIIGLFDVRTGENLCYFMFHGLILIIWEGVFGTEKEGAMKGSVKKSNDYDFRKNVCLFLKWSLLFSIYTLALPGFVEPFIRKLDHWVIPSLFSDIKDIGNHKIK